MTSLMTGGRIGLCRSSAVLAVAAGMAVAVCACTSETASPEAAESAVGGRPVELIRAWKVAQGVYGQSWVSSGFEILVAAGGANRAVDLFAQGSDGGWRAFPASRSSDVSGGRQIWKVENAGAVGKFAIRYRIDGQEYWDNNGGADYELRDSGALLPPSSNLQRATAFGLDSHFPRSVYVEADVRNVARDKNVSVVFTTDGWKTVKSTPLKFRSDFMYGYGTVHSPNAHGIERWSGEIDAGNADRVEYVLRYDVSGRTYWDNGFGVNYVETRKK